MSEKTRIELEEVFDVEASLALCRRLAALPVASAVTLDCRRTRHVDGFAFAALLKFLGGATAPSVSTHGLSQCHRRVMQYLGLAY